MKKYTKRDIENIILSESKGCKIYKKKELKLKEDNETNKTYVDGSGSPSDVSMAANKALTNSPTSDSAVVPMSNFDSKSGNNVNTVKASSNKPQDIKNAINSVKPGTNYNLEIPRNESIDYLRNNSVSFTKKEIKKLLK